MSQPSNLKVKRLDELPLLPAELAGEAFTYAVVDSTDYQLNAGVLAEAAAEGVLDELVDILAPVALSNSYNDLDDKPFIPQNSDDLPQGTTNLYATAAEKSKLAGIAAGAQVNTVTSVAGKTGAVTLTSSDTGSEPAFSKGSIIAGDGVNIAGTTANRLVGSGDITITATGEGGGVVVEVLAGDGIAVDSTDVASPVVSLTSAAQSSLALADTAVQPADLSTVATTGSYNDLSDAPTGSTSIVLTGGQWQRAAVIGDVTLPANSNTATIANRAVTNAKMADVSAGTLKGRDAGAGTGSPQDLDPATVRAMLNVANGATANVGTVVTVGASVPTGFSVTGVPITSSGTIAISYASGYQGYTTAESNKLSGIASGATVGANWNTNLTNIPANITSWASISPSTKATVGSDVAFRDITASRGDGTGVIFLNAANTRYVYFNGTVYDMPGAGLSIGGSVTSSGVFTDVVGNVRDIPIYDFTNGEGIVQTGRGRCYAKRDNTARSLWIPLNAAVAITIGTAITVVNMGGTTGNVTIVRNGGVSLYKNGTNADIVIAPGHSATIIKVATDVWQA